MTEAQKELKVIGKYFHSEEVFPKSFKVIKKALREGESQKEVLQIITDKMVNVADVIDSFVFEDLGYNHYTKYHDNYSYKLLSREEFDTLIKFFFKKFFLTNK